MVPIRNTTPIRISTTGPAIERCGGRGVGGIIGLVTVHLTSGRNGWYGWNRRRGRNRASGRGGAGCQRRNVSFSRGGSLQQLDAADNQQNAARVAEKTNITETVDQSDYTDRHEDRGPHQALSPTLLARATLSGADQSPASREYPTADSDKNHSPETVEIQIKQTSRVQQEDRAHNEEHDRAHRDFAGLDLCPAAKSGRQAEGIWDRLRHLDRLCRTHRIDDLVDVKKGDAEAADNAQSFAMSVVARAGPGDEQSEDGQVRQSFGVLPGVDGAHAKGEESGEDSGHRRVRAAAASRRRRRGNLPGR